MAEPINNGAQPPVQQQTPIQPVEQQQVPVDATATATPVTASNGTHAAAAPAHGGPIDDQDVKLWSDRAKDILARPSEHLNSRSAAGAQSWFAGFFDCINPVDTCLITCCVPCVTFGKTHHRMHKDSELKGYEPVNTSCLLLCGSGCVGLFCVPIAIQRQMQREKYGLEGSCVDDLLRAWCCGCCSLIQQDKEAEHREGLLRQGQVGSKQTYEANPGMVYPNQ